jgi:hypothetical protein
MLRIKIWPIFILVGVLQAFDIGGNMQRFDIDQIVKLCVLEKTMATFFRIVLT